MTARRKKRSVITKAEALRRISVIADKVEDNIKMAIYDEAVLEEGNDRVQEMKDKAIVGSIAYDVIQRGLVTNLCITLNRLFDAGSKRYSVNKRDVASIIILMRLVRQRRCVKALSEQAKLNSLGLHQELHVFQCTNALHVASDAYVDCMTTYGPKSLERLRRYRNHELAHNQITELKGAYPRFRELFKLVDLAIAIIVPLRLAISAKNIDLKSLRYAARHEAGLFWDGALQNISN